VTNPKIIPCKKSEELVDQIEEYVKALKRDAPKIGNHGLPPGEFWESGIFHGAIERLRGRTAAATKGKRDFMEAVLRHLAARGDVKKWTFAGAGERHDYEVVTSGGQLCAIEAKGCLDGNNTTIFQRPRNAERFLIWSLCQNPGADPQKNAWSGIHTRLSAEILHKGEQVDGVIIWDMLCGTPRRLCPKLERDPRRATTLGMRRVPPPCVYLFPRTLADPRNNPRPSLWRLDDIEFLRALHNAFNGQPDDVTEVKFEVRMEGAEYERRTVYARAGEELGTSDWAKIKRARR